MKYIRRVREKNKQKGKQEEENSWINNVNGNQAGISKQCLIHAEQERTLSEYLERLFCLAYGLLLNIIIQFQKKDFAKKNPKNK